MRWLSLKLRNSQLSHLEGMVSFIQQWIKNGLSHIMSYAKFMRIPTTSAPYELQI